MADETVNELVGKAVSQSETFSGFNLFEKQINDFDRLNGAQVAQQVIEKLYLTNSVYRVHLVDGLQNMGLGYSFPRSKVVSGNRYTVSAMIRSAQQLCIQAYDGVNYSIAEYSGSGLWERVKLTFTLQAGITPVSVLFGNNATQYNNGYFDMFDARFELGENVGGIVEAFRTETKGEDGASLYTWIKYSDNADGTGLYDTPKSSTMYIGIATNKASPVKSGDKSDYTWSRFKGDKGDAGKDADNSLLTAIKIYRHQNFL